MSDRIARLNEQGRELIRRVLKKNPTGVAAQPLDLCDDDRASLWLQELEDEYRLGLINWSAEAQAKIFSFQEFGLEAPAQVADFWTGARLLLQGDELAVDLAAHASAFLRWPKEGAGPELKTSA